MQKISAILFDLDGVLMDSSAIHAEAFRGILERYGIEDVDYSRLAGRTTPASMHLLFSEANIQLSETEFKQVCDEKRARAQAGLLEAKPIDPQCHPTLQRLAKAFSIALATSANHRNLEFFLNESGTRDFFWSRLTGEDVTHPKPDPEIFLRSAENLGVPPEECLVIEDAKSGIEAAIAAGMRVLIRRGTLTAPFSHPQVLGEIDALPEIFNHVLGPIHSTSSKPFPTSIDPSRWTAVLPLAGRGTRLGSEQPKALYPILERPILSWLLELVENTCQSIVLVVSPSGEKAIRAWVETSPFKDRVRYVLQTEPKGMADALWQAKSQITTPNTLVLWGDQLGLKQSTLETCAQAHEARPNAQLTLPTTWKRHPYISISRNENGQIIEVGQAREAEVKGEEGENDCGLFLFRTKTLFETLEKARENKWAIGKKTGEQNLLPLFPHFEQGPGSVLTLQTATEEETLGVNTPEQAQQLGQILASR